MDLYSAERFVMERHQATTCTAEHRARLLPESGAPMRVWMAGRLRSLADRIDTQQRFEPVVRVLSE